MPLVPTAAPPPPAQARPAPPAPPTPPPASPPASAASLGLAAAAAGPGPGSALQCGQRAAGGGTLLQPSSGAAGPEAQPPGPLPGPRPEWPPTAIAHTQTGADEAPSAGSGSMAGRRGGIGKGRRAAPPRTAGVPPCAAPAPSQSDDQLSSSSPPPPPPISQPPLPVPPPPQQQQQQQPQPQPQQQQQQQQQQHPCRQAYQDTAEGRGEGREGGRAAGPSGSPDAASGHRRKASAPEPGGAPAAGRAEGPTTGAGGARAWDAGGGAQDADVTAAAHGGAGASRTPVFTSSTAQTAPPPPPPPPSAAKLCAASDSPAVGEARSQPAIVSDPVPCAGPRPRAQRSGFIVEPSGPDDSAVSESHSPARGSEGGPGSGQPSRGGSDSGGTASDSAGDSAVTAGEDGDTDAEGGDGGPDLDGGEERGRRKDRAPRCRCPEPSNSAVPLLPAGRRILQSKEYFSGAGPGPGAKRVRGPGPAYRCSRLSVLVGDGCVCRGGWEGSCLGGLRGDREGRATREVARVGGQFNCYAGGGGGGVCDGGRRRRFVQWGGWGAAGIPRWR